jgi:hypothetical protein
MSPMEVYFGVFAIRSIIEPGAPVALIRLDRERRHDVASQTNARKPPSNSRR